MAETAGNSQVMDNLCTNWRSLDFTLKSMFKYLDQSSHKKTKKKIQSTFIYICLSISWLWLILNHLVQLTQKGGWFIHNQASQDRTREISLKRGSRDTTRGGGKSFSSPSSLRAQTFLLGFYVPIFTQNWKMPLIWSSPGKHASPHPQNPHTGFLNYVFIPTMSGIFLLYSFSWIPLLSRRIGMRK